MLALSCGENGNCDEVFLTRFMDGMTLIMIYDKRQESRGKPGFCICGDEVKSQRIAIPDPANSFNRDQPDEAVSYPACSTFAHEDIDDLIHHIISNQHAYHDLPGKIRQCFLQGGMIDESWSGKTSCFQHGQTG